MNKSENTKMNFDKTLKDLTPKNMKITEEALEMIKNLAKDFLTKVSIDLGDHCSTTFKTLLTQDDVLKVICKYGLSRYILELEEEQKRYYREGLTLSELTT
jgi:histone H3/H4